MNPAPKAHVIKIGLVQDGKLISENVFQDDAEVTIGTDPSDSIFVNDPSMPKRHNLFVQTKNGFELNYLPSMDGRLSLKGGFYELRKLVDGGVAQEHQGFSTVYLGDLSKGKINFGTTTILFQVISPVSTAPLKKLPKEYRGAIVKRVDMAFMIVILVSALMHISMVGYLNSIPQEDIISKIEKPPEWENLPEVPPEAIVTIDEEVKKPTDEEGEGGAGKTSKGSGKGKGSGGGDAEKPFDANQVGLLAVLNTAASKDGSVANVMGNSGLDSSIKDTMGKISGGVKAAGPGNLAGGGGGGGGGDIRTVGSGDLMNAGGPGKGGTGEKTEHKVKAAPVAASGNTSGNVNADSARTYILSRIGGIRSCYEKQLRIDPTLSGKVAVTFSIGDDGGVASCSVTNSTISDSSIGGCVCNMISRWRFPQGPDSGAGSVNYSFIFTPATN